MGVVVTHPPVSLTDVNRHMKGGDKGTGLEGKLPVEKAVSVFPAEFPCLAERDVAFSGFDRPEQEDQRTEQRARQDQRSENV